MTHIQKITFWPFWAGLYPVLLLKQDPDYVQNLIRFLQKNRIGFAQENRIGFFCRNRIPFFGHNNSFLFNSTLILVNNTSKSLFMPKKSEKFRRIPRNSKISNFSFCSLQPSSGRGIVILIPRSEA